MGGDEQAQSLTQKHWLLEAAAAESLAAPRPRETKQTQPCGGKTFHSVRTEPHFHRLFIWNIFCVVLNTLPHCEAEGFSFRKRVVYRKFAFPLTKSTSGEQGTYLAYSLPVRKARAGRSLCRKLGQDLKQRPFTDPLPGCA